MPVSYVLLFCIFKFNSPFNFQNGCIHSQSLAFLIFNHASLYKNKNVRHLPFPFFLPLRFFSTQTQTLVNPAVYDILVHTHHFPTEFATLVASELSNSMKNPERVDSMLTFLKSSGFSNAQLQKILKCRPGYLGFSLEDNIKPKIEGLKEEGFSSDDISTIISRCPTILRLSLKKNIIPSLSLLRNLLGSNTALVTLLRRSPRLLTYNMEATLVPNVQLLKSYGLSMARIRIILNAFPQAFCHKPEALRSVDKAQEMGLTAASNAFIYAISTFASMSNEGWELKLQEFRDVGFSESDISTMFGKEPRVFCTSAEKLKKISEGLAATGKFDLLSIVEYPVSLRYSFEQRYEPRMRVLSITESRGLIENWPTLRTLCQLTNAEFYERFVSPYLDHLGDICIPKLR